MLQVKTILKLYIVVSSKKIILIWIKMGRREQKQQQQKNKLTVKIVAWKIQIQLVTWSRMSMMSTCKGNYFINFSQYIFQNCVLLMILSRTAVNKKLTRKFLLNSTKDEVTNVFLLQFFYNTNNHLLITSHSTYRWKCHSHFVGKYNNHQN